MKDEKREGALSDASCHYQDARFDEINDDSSSSFASLLLRPSPLLSRRNLRASGRGHSPTLPLSTDDDDPLVL